MKFGIDKIGFYIPKYYIDMRELATMRGIDPDKFTYGLGQDEMSVPPLTQDMISLATNAAYNTISEQDLNDIDLVILATETGSDFSKSGSTSIVSLLGINPKSRCIEIKQACYSATAALQFAKNHLQSNDDKKVLIIASDISRYGLDTSGEATQGAGAVAMLITKDPSLLVLSDKSSYFSEDVWDFWRPNYSDTAIVDGHYSNEQYQRFFNQTFEDYKEKYDRQNSDFDAFLFHIPYTKLGRKTLINYINPSKEIINTFNQSTLFNRKVGNIYTGSLYLSLISLLYNADLDANARIGLYSYGSGAVGEFFSMKLVEGYQDALDPNLPHQFDTREKLTIKDYESMFTAELVSDGSHMILPDDNETFQLKEIKGHRRYYQKN
ncbi:hydroxymethylglutaryl-CoA synthase [Erysipelothrix urinaevulpis]|uniref:hydroxymethylglutaryl-CoA synthase n=1 Tax=Erysipelothrix urinaevulpis TaxID=2683717 RepID=UPI00135A372D|nr:hydroxymethylglutaryl-CoA synthase [Erysipelothrix urinaevulpis]